MWLIDSKERGGAEGLKYFVIKLKHSNAHTIVQMPHQSNIPDQVGVIQHISHVLHVICGLRKLLLLDLKVLVLYGFNQWLVEGLCVFFLNYCFHIGPIHFYSLWIIPGSNLVITFYFSVGKIVVKKNTEQY